MSSTPYQSSNPSTTPRPPPYYAATNTSSPQPRHRPSPTPSFTPTMRDRQARGKDPFSGSAGEFPPPRTIGPGPQGGSSSGGAGGGGGAGGRPHSDSDADEGDDLAFIGGGASERQRGESYEAYRRREWARDVLESPEMLMWYASSREDSIPGTRLYFTRVLCGFEEDHVPQQEPTQRKSSGSASGRSHGHKRR